MDVTQVRMTREAARELFQKYRTHAHYSTPIDVEIQRTYKLIAAGRIVIKALESIVQAGLGPQGFPRLAIAPADATAVDCRTFKHGGAVMDARKYQSWRSNDDNKWIAERAYIQFPRGSFAGAQDLYRGMALVPGAPLHLRPKRGLANYHILWEAEWTRIVPRDPYLLRRIGKSDLWLVCAQWDLTEVERGALATRL